MPRLAASWRPMLQLVSLLALTASAPSTRQQLINLSLSLLPNMVHSTTVSISRLPLAAHLPQGTTTKATATLVATLEATPAVMQVVMLEATLAVILVEMLGETLAVMLEATPAVILVETLEGTQVTRPLLQQVLPLLPRRRRKPQEATMGVTDSNALNDPDSEAEEVRDLVAIGDVDRRWHANVVRSAARVFVAHSLLPCLLEM